MSSSLPEIRLAPSATAQTAQKSSIGQELFRQLASLPGCNQLSLPGRSQVVSLNRDDLLEECRLSDDGYVKQVVHRPTGTPFAWKIVPIQWSLFNDNTEDARTLRQQIREITTFQSYQGDERARFLIKFLGFGVDSGEISICTELMHGDLRALRRQFCERQGSFPRNTLQYVAFVLVEALGYLKEKQIMHRDVKPDNLLYALAGTQYPQGVIKLTDFGISKLLECSRARTCVSTEFYMPPERLRNEQHEYGVESDIWAMGVVLLELFRNRYPFVETREERPMERETVRKAKEFLRNCRHGYQVSCEEMPDAELRDFINLCLRPCGTRPTSYALLQHTPLISRFHLGLYRLAFDF